MMTTQMSNPLDKYRGKGIGNGDEKKEVSLDSQIETIISEYEAQRESFKPGRIQNCPSLSVVPTPAEVTSLFNAFKEDKDSRYRFLGRFVSLMVQKSYQAGFNEFYINSEGVRVDYLPCFLKGRKENPLRIRVDGDLGRYCGIQMEHVYLTVGGTVGESFSGDSSMCQFDVQKIVENGDVLFNKIALRNNETRRDLHPKKCTYVVYNKDDFVFLMRELNPKSRIIWKKGKNTIEHLVTKSSYNEAWKI